MENNASTIEMLFERAEDYTRTTVELAKLNAVDKTADVMSSLLSRLTVSIVFVLFAFLANIGLSLWIGELLGKVYYGLSNHFSVFASLTGDIQRNTLNNFVAENPWINQNISLQNTNKQTDFTAGFKAGIGNALSFQLSGSYERYKNLYFFVNSAKDSTRFDAIYEGLYTKVFKTTGELIFDQNKLRMGLKADFYNYSLTTISTPFHRPTFVGNFFAKYNIGKNLYFNIDFYYISGIKARKNLTEQQPLSAIADLNLKAEYFLKGNFSVFASLNNVFSNKYQRYLNYSNRGFQSMLGFTYAF